MITIDANQYSALTCGARVLERNPRYGPSVFRTDDGRIIKVFQRNRRFAPARWSYVRRFTRHAAQLARRGFQSVTVEAVYRCREQGADLVVYPMLPGRTLRELAGADARRALSALPEFLVELHRGGVHFRGIHFGNLLVDDDHRFALIDIGYMRFYPWPVDLYGRASNFRNILRYPQDASMLDEFGFRRFMERYFVAAGLSRRRCSRLARLIAKGPVPDSFAAELERIAHIQDTRMTQTHDSYLDTRERFNSEAVARDYVAKKNTLDNAKNRREMACIVAALKGLPAGSRVLDLPCGTGRLESMLVDAGYDVVAADYSMPMIEAARAWHAAGVLADPGRGDRLRFEQQDVMCTTYPDLSFDAVICNRLLHHYPEAAVRRRVLAELARICRGRIVVSYYDNLALSALKFHLRNRLRGIRPVDRIPIWSRVFRGDCEAVGLRVERTLPVRYGVSPQTYALLTRGAE